MCIYRTVFPQITVIGSKIIFQVHVYRKDFFLVQLQVHEYCSLKVKRPIRSLLHVQKMKCCVIAKSALLPYEVLYTHALPYYKPGIVITSELDINFFS